MPHRPRRPFLPRLPLLLVAAGVAVLGTAVGASAETAPPLAGGRHTLRLGFTYSMFTGVNENDAKASIKALAATIARERGIPADPDPLLFNGTEAVAAATQAGAVDAVGMTTDEYSMLAGGARFDRYLMAVRNDNPTEEYVVLVRRAEGWNNLSALRGKRLSVFVNSRMSLASVWLEVLLARAGLPPSGEHFARVTGFSKLSKVVLDVFFRQTDACLVSRQGFATMNELNPQVGAQLVALTVSEPMVPSLFAFRTDMAPALKEKSLHEFALVNASPAGQQALTIFQVGQVAERPVAALASALALLNEFSRLRPAASAARTAALRHRLNLPAVSTTP